MTEIDGIHAPKLAAPSVMSCCEPLETASIMSREPPICPPVKPWMSTRPAVLAFTSVATRSIICTCGCVPPTTSPQRITSVCASAWVLAAVAATRVAAHSTRR